MISRLSQYETRMLCRRDHHRRTALLVIFCCAGFAIPVGGAAEPPAAGSQASSVTMTKAEILASPRWKRAQKSLNDWLSVQNIYSPEEVVQLQKEWADEVDEMDADELQDLLDDMEERLKILLSPQVEQARAWIGSYLAVLADPHREALRKQLPDVANMTAAQIQQSLREFQLAQQKHAGQGAREANQRQQAVTQSGVQTTAKPPPTTSQNQTKTNQAKDRAKQSANNSLQNARERARTTPEWYRKRRGWFGWFR